VEWIWAGVAIGAGFLLATTVSRVLRIRMENRGGRSAQLAAAVASLAFSLILVVGLLVALGFVQPDSLEKLRDDTIEYLPRALSALIVVILGGVAGTIVSTAARQSLGRSMGRFGEKLPTIIKSVVTAFAAILAASQLGIDTTVINIVVAACVFGLAAAFAMVVGFGSRPIATEIASGRALRRLMSAGDNITTPTTSGTIVALHATAVELDDGESTSLVPYSTLAATNVKIERQHTPAASA